MPSKGSKTLFDLKGDFQVIGFELNGEFSVILIWTYHHKIEIDWQWIQWPNFNWFTSWNRTHCNVFLIWVFLKNLSVMWKHNCLCLLFVASAWDNGYLGSLASLSSSFSSRCHITRPFAIWSLIFFSSIFPHQFFARERRARIFDIIWM